MTEHEPTAQEFSYDAAKSRIWEIAAAFWRGEMTDEERDTLRTESLEYFGFLKEAFDSGRIDGEDKNLLRIWVNKEVLPVLEQFENGVSFQEMLDGLPEDQRIKMSELAAENYVAKEQRQQRPKGVAEGLRELFEVKN